MLITINDHCCAEENADVRKMSLYPVCLANRSAALYQTKDYYYCVNDIDEALEHHYPKVRDQGSLCSLSLVLINLVKI